MSGQIILIAGALTGIGRATALAAVGQGYKIVLSGRNNQTGAALEAELGSLSADGGKTAG